ncbi:MAG: uroporphyrinogen-III C-methyltransferase [Chloroflexi bacterium]|nr:uroporphyrinogen-III C-methyltransferase [Chloroflexota bacterium]
MSKTGIVYIVGAGPGDPGLITVKGADALRRADVVVYDRLSSPQLLDLAPPSAKLVFMGKEPDTPGAFQEQINRTLAKAALDGKTVVRLKGGDPFVFGRGGEEAAALRAAGVRFEVVPGITSAIAVPAYAGVPVTQRGVASAFTVVTGSEDPSKPESALDWDALAKTPGTLVVLMGWRPLSGIVRSLLANGRSPETPVAVTQWGTLPKQRTVAGTLADIIAKGDAAGLTSPVVTVIGDVAGLREGLRWFDTGPLFGMRVLVTRSRQQAGVLGQLLSAEGAEPIELPTIEIAPLEDFGALDDALERIGSYAWAVFTSTNGVDAAFGRLAEGGRDARGLGGVRVAAIGPATAAALAHRGIIADYVPDTFTTEAVAEGFGDLDVDGARVLLLRADIAPDALPEGLRRLGAEVDSVAAYRTLKPSGASERARELLGSGSIDVATFTSSSTVRNLVELLGRDRALLDGIRIASIGPVTSAAARELGLRVDVEAREHTVPGLVRALVDQQEGQT